MTRRYADHEVKLILRRALEASGEDAGVPAGEGGLSLQQIRDIAAEVGIDPARVDLAAAALTRPAPRAVNPYVGIPTAAQFETTLVGKTLADMPQHDVLAVVRSTLGRQGLVDTRSGSLEWKARDATGGRYVSLEPTTGGVRLRVLGNYRDALGMMVAGVGMAGLTAGAIVLKALGVDPVVALLLSGAGAMLPPRLVYRWWRKREDGTMRTLFTRLVALLGAAPGKTAPEQIEGETSPDRRSDEGG